MAFIHSCQPYGLFSYYQSLPKSQQNKNGLLASDSFLSFQPTDYPCPVIFPHAFFKEYTVKRYKKIEMNTTAPRKPWNNFFIFGLHKFK